MARTKAEIRAFLDSKVGSIVPHPGYPDLNGQCVTLTKALMEFLGVPNPYKARGNAKDAGDTYIREGIGSPGKGWLTIVVNRDMGYIDGVHYGHIWIDLTGEANYESNGKRALYTTKNTRPISQGQQFINFDKWVSGEGNDVITKEDIYSIRVIMSEVEGWNGHLVHSGKYDDNILSWVGKTWEEMIQHCWAIQPTHRIHLTDKLTVTEAAVKDLKTSTAQLSKTVDEKNAQIIAQQKEIESLKAQVGDNSKWETLKALLRELLGTGGK